MLPFMLWEVSASVTIYSHAFLFWGVSYRLGSQHSHSLEGRRKSTLKGEKLILLSKSCVPSIKNQVSDGRRWLSLTTVLFGNWNVRDCRLAPINITVRVGLTYSWNFCPAHSVFCAPETSLLHTVCFVILGFMSWTWCVPCSWDFCSAHSVLRALGTSAHSVFPAPETSVLHTVCFVHLGFLFLTWCALCSWDCYSPHFPREKWVRGRWRKFTQCSWGQVWNSYSGYLLISPQSFLIHELPINTILNQPCTRKAGNPASISAKGTFFICTHTCIHACICIHFRCKSLNANSLPARWVGNIRSLTLNNIAHLLLSGRAGSALKITDYFSRGPEFNSQYPYHTAACNTRSRGYDTSCLLKHLLSDT